MTRDQLRALNCKQLAELARQRGVAGWHDLRKEALVQALQRSYRNEARRKKPAPARKLVAPVQRAAARNTSGAPDDAGSSFRVSGPSRPLPQPVRELPAEYNKDRIVLLVRDPFWLHCYWELTRQAMDRAEAALGQEWHTAKPILRLLDVTSTDARSAERAVRDIEIHGGVSNWYIDVTQPPRSYRVDIGYLTRSSRFYVLARSNPATTPQPGVSDAVDTNWADLDPRKADRLYAMSSGFDPAASSLEVKQFFEERLRRPLGAPTITSLGSGGLLPPGRSQEFAFSIDADLVVYGRTRPGSQVKLQNQPVQLRDDGSFTLRFKLPDNRQIIPCVAVSPDGGEERTVVLAVERNIRHLEPAPQQEQE